ncbi:MAG TPA: DNA repair protein RadC [Symbiobacteriaceae bacterium]|nr:DNA repair protein RadC [Symbiobacteriaceae bacterium]
MAVPVRLLPVEERPRERMLQFGPEKLTDAELLAILLRTGVRGQSVIELAHEILHHCESKDRSVSPLEYLRQLNVHEVSAIASGIGEAKACQLLAGLHLGWRATAGLAPDVVDLNNPGAVYRYLEPRFSQLEQEQFLAVLLTAKNQLICVEEITVGTQTSTLVHPREIFKAAIRRSAHAIILAHNHPSGDPTPSREDREVTRRMIEAGRVIGIEVLDHLVIGKRRYVSFREKGLADWS